MRGQAIGWDGVYSREYSAMGSYTVCNPHHTTRNMLGHHCYYTVIMLGSVLLHLGSRGLAAACQCTDWMGALVRHSVAAVSGWCTSMLRVVQQGSWQVAIDAYTS